MRSESAVMPEPPISTLEFRLADSAAIPFEIGRLETTHQVRTSRRP